MKWMKSKKTLTVLLKQMWQTIQQGRTEKAKTQLKKVTALLKNEKLCGYQLMDQDPYPKPNHSINFTCRSLENKRYLNIPKDQQNKFLQNQIMGLSEGSLVKLNEEWITSTQTSPSLANMPW